MINHKRPSHRLRRRCALEILESRHCPAIVSIRAGVGTAVVQDTTISASTPDDVALDAGRLDIAGPTNPMLARQTLLKFDQLIGTGVGQIPLGATILHANLCLWAVDGSSSSVEIDVRQLLSSWDVNTSTWDSWTNGVQFDGIEASPSADITFSPGPHGYQVSGQNLKNTLQQWANGQPNLGWVISTTSTDASWALASSDNPEIDKRPCLSVDFTAPGYTNPTYVELAGPPPLATSLAWFDWDNDLRERRVARVPSERATTFYFSQAGDDVTGTGTIDQPWKSLAKAKAMLTESGGQGMRFRFRRGDVWRESTAMFPGYYVSGYTIDDYGDPGAAKPVFSRFLPLAESGWQPVGGNLYKFETPPGIGWVREAADGFTRIYYRAASSAEVGQRLQSWYYDADGTDPNSLGVPTLYLNCGTNPATFSGGFEACPDDGLGWVNYGDNVRLQNIRIEGFGVSQNGQSYGLSIGHQSILHEFVGIGVDVYYTGYHAIGHLVQYDGSKGAATLIDCSAGLCVNRYFPGDVGYGDITVYVAYGDFGGNEFIAYNCEAKYGTLPSAEWFAEPGMAHGSAFYCHVGPGGRLELVIIEKMRTGECENPVNSRSQIDNAVPASNLADVRAYIVEDGSGPGYSKYIGQYIAVINSIFDYTDPPPSFDYHYSLNYNTFATGWLINCTIKIDATFQDSYFFSFMHTVVQNHVGFINCHIDIYNATRPLYWDNPFPNGPNLSGCQVSNTIISLSSSFSTGLGIPNDSVHLQNNAYYLPNLENANWGYSGDIGAVTLDGRYPAGLRPTPSSPLYDGGLANLVEYDQQRQPRGSLRTIGPLNGAALPLPTEITASWGMRSAILESNTSLWSPKIDRVQLEFAEDVDLGFNALRLYDAVGQVPWASFSYESSSRRAQWLLTAPLPKGNYTLELDGQPIRAFSVLPGDFDGNGIVSASDFSIFRLNYSTTEFLGDLNGDGQITALDFSLFRQSFGTTL